MIKRIQERYECSEKEAELYYFAYINKLCHMLQAYNMQEELEELDMATPNNRKLYDDILEELTSRGIYNKRLLAINGYNTIVYSRSLGELLAKYCRKYNGETIVDIIEEYYRQGMKSANKTMTLLNFFKDLTGGGINYYIEKHNELLF